jgi:hypothetical protein
MESTDWKCKCGEINFRRNVSCRKCNLPKLRSGDWYCECGELNFASRKECRKCTKIACKDTQQPKFEHGDWICKDCNEHNFKSRHICRKCSSPKNTANQQEDIEKMCVVCLESQKTHAIIKCGHLVYCGICGYKIKDCPVCRQSYDPNKDLIKIYNI